MDDYSINFEEIPVKLDEVAVQNVNESEIGPQNGFLGTLCLFYSSSPFSDFAPTPFNIDGKLYPSIEHYVQLQMFQSFGLFKLSHKLNAITDAVEFRRVVRQNIKSLAKSDIFPDNIFQAWRDKNLEKVLRKANYAKYQQNLLIREQLQQTGDRILIFTAKNDNVLGIGMSESSFFGWISSEKIMFEDLLNYFCDDKCRPRELGRNLLGLILMEIRADYNEEPSVVDEWKQKQRAKEKILSQIISPDTSKLVEIINIEDVNDTNSTKLNVADPNFSVENCAAGKSSDEFIGATSSQIVFETDANQVQALLKQDSTVCLVDNQRDNSHNQADTPKKVYDRTVVMLNDERRILYHKIGSEPRVIGGEQCSRGLSCSSTKALPMTGLLSSVEQKQSALKRLKALRFEKPIINPFTPTSPSELLLPAKTVVVPSCSVPKINDHIQYIEKFNPCSGVKRPRLQPPPARLKQQLPPPVIGSGDMYDLEPGEVPNPNYKPPHPFFNPFKRHTDYPEIPSLVGIAFERSPNERDPKVEIEEILKTTTKAWKPSGNPLKDLLHKAQETMKKLEESGENPIACVSMVEPSQIFPPFPTSSKLAEPKRSKKEKKIGKQYKVRFTNDTAMLRHHSNRWMLGGKLSSTGKFEEEDDDDEVSSNERETFEEQCRVMKMLQEVEDKMIKKHYETQIAYEDTHQYEEYLKWHAETHNQSMPDANDDPRQAEQRKWYQFYRNAVKFVDIPDDSDERNTTDYADDQAQPSENYLNDFTGLSYSKTYDVMLQQWRWKQIHQWKPNLSHDTNTVTSTDGVSYGGQPVVYQKIEETERPEVCSDDDNVSCINVNID